VRFGDFDLCQDEFEVGFDEGYHGLLPAPAPGAIPRASGQKHQLTGSSPFWPECRGLKSAASGLKGIRVRRAAFPKVQ
jgi:hypothetical protein